ncbi:oligopeptide:H+ symporter [Halomonas piscis]|uniref:Oligopeptide:H+ symporter n=1 Tax=Halomonas piscis TaxID=3031727 RepID=A0ABY9Z1Q6_9GAMM|nr:oligopeptide:H+ symporter [Halomonas piscis]WNK21048.1 oligopeptide:H+ symporter [Halomonas piscis]
MGVESGECLKKESPEGVFGAARGHPKGLLTLASVELWERLSFYGLQVILAYYLYYAVNDGGLGLPQEQALAITGAYGGCVYLMQPVGAWLADRVFPVRLVVLVSGCLIMAGHITIALAPGLQGLLMGLGLIALGTGGLFPNVIAMVGKLYKDKPVRRDSGFSLFYTGIMFGALAGPFITGYLHSHFGFHYAFTAAAVGMAIGLIIYVARWSTLPEDAKRVPRPLGRKDKIKALAPVFTIAAAAFFAGIGGWITLDNVDLVVLLAIGLVTFAYFSVMIASSSVDKSERRKIYSFIPVYIAAIIFWTMVLQLFTTFAVYADTRVDLRIGFWEIPPAYISVFQVIAGIIAGPFIAAAWQKMGERQPSTASKMAIGLVVMAAAYATFALLPLLHEGYIGLVPVIMGMVIFGIAEVTFAPLIFSASSQLAPRAFYSQMVSLSGLVIGAGASLSGFVGKLYNASYESVFFSVIAACVLGAALMLFLLRSWLQRCGLG